MKLVVLILMMMNALSVMAEGASSKPLQENWQDYGLAGLLLTAFFWVVRANMRRAEAADKLTHELVKTAIDTNTHVKVLDNKVDNIQRDVEDVKSDVKVIKTTVEQGQKEVVTKRRTLKPR